MSNEKEEIAKLRAEVATLAAALKQAAAGAAKAEAASAVYAAAKVEASNKRAELKAKTKKQGDSALYFLPEGTEPFYRKGVTYQPGTIVALPLSEDPSVHWEPVADAAPAPVLKPAPLEPKKRASDRDVL